MPKYSIAVVLSAPSPYGRQAACIERYRDHSRPSRIFRRGNLQAMQAYCDKLSRVYKKHGPEIPIDIVLVELKLMGLSR